MRKLIPVIILCLLLAGVNVYAQRMQVWLQETDRLQLVAPKFLARTGNQYQVIDVVQGQGAVLLKIDSGLSKIESRLSLPVEAYGTFVGGANDTALAVWRQEKNDSIVIHLLESAKGEGNEQVHRWAISKEKNPALAYVVHDLNNRFFFFYSGYNDTVGRMLLNGILLDRISKQATFVSWPIDFDLEEQRLKVPVIDGFGNIHTVIYDKLTNYKLSASVHVYTRNAADQSTIVETFGFDKIKLYDVDFFDNPAAGEIQLRGFYYSGDEKLKIGLASIGFPYARTNKLSQRFTPLPDWQKLFLVEGVGAYNKRFDPLDYLKATGYDHQAGSSVISAWVLDMPYKNFAKDREQENVINTAAPTWLSRKKEDGWVQKSAMPSQRNDQLQRQQSNNMLSETRAYRFGLVNLNSEHTILPPTTKDVRNRIPSEVPRNMPVPPLVKMGKIAFFVMNEKGMYDWLQAVAPNFPFKATQRTTQLLGSSMLYQNTIYVVVPVTEGEKERLQLIQMGKSGITELLLNESIPARATYTVPKQIEDGYFISIYTDAVQQKSGILHLKVKQSNN